MSACCRCRDDTAAFTTKVRLDRNDLGPAILQAVDGLRRVRCICGRSWPGYRGGLDCEKTAELLGSVAALEKVPVANVRLCGSLLTHLQQLPFVHGRKTAVALSTDFPKYLDRAPKMGLKVRLIDIDINATQVDPELVAAAVRDLDQAVLYLTMPFTNPGGHYVDEEVIEAALAANPALIVIVDGAYVRFALSKPQLRGMNYAHAALEDGRLIYVQSGDKSLGGLCDSKVSWIVGTEERLAEFDEWSMSPFPITGDGMQRAIQLIGSPAICDRITVVQKAARDRLALGLATLEVPVLTNGNVPWVLAFTGGMTDRVVGQLRRRDIYVQRQSARAYTGWIRVSATVEPEAKLFLAAIEEILDGAAGAGQEGREA